MSQLRVHCFSVSLDGYGAGPHQSLEHPMGIGAMELHSWVFPTATFQRTVLGQAGGSEGIDDEYAARGFRNLGAWILGRNMFGPVRGDWPDEKWRGWWGDNPPYHVPVFVLTHYKRAPIEMEGGTTFHFVTEGIEEARKRAKAAAKGLDVRLGGGVATLRQYLRAGLVDELHLAYSPTLLGAGEHLFVGLNLRSLGYRCVEHAATEKAVHYVLRKDGGAT
jgi:dihydrofolate reductase